MAPALRGRGLMVGMVLALASLGHAHDIWVESGQAMFRTGSYVNLSLMLGNHGNHHRDFRLAAKVLAGKQNLMLRLPSGRQLDLTPNLIDNGYEPKEGFWSTGFVAEEKGVYLAVSNFDSVMSYAPVRDIKCAKAYFATTPSLDRPTRTEQGFAKPVGAPFELVPVTNPCFGVGPGSTFQVKLLRNGKPLPNATVSFIPKGVELVGDLDKTYEAKANAKGIASVTLRQAGPWLIASHLADSTAKGEGYESIGYSATLWLSVPTNCPCCMPPTRVKKGAHR